MKHPESDMQMACVRWFRLQYPRHAELLFAVPNGGRRDVREAARLKAEGVVSGIPDLFLAVTHPKHSVCGLFIELKAGKGRLTDNQKRIIFKLRDQYYTVEVCNTVGGFMSTINNYMELCTT